MKTTCVGLALLTACLTAVATPVAAQQAPSSSLVRDTTLANGLTVYVIENHAVPLVTAELVVRGGAMTQDASTEGIPGLYVHTNNVGRRLLLRDLIPISGAFAANTNFESVSQSITVPSGKTRDGLSLLAQDVLNPSFDDAGVQGGLIAVAGEFQRQASNPEVQLQRAVDQHLWSTAWPRKDNLGTPPALTAANAGSLEAFYHRYWVPGNAGVIVSGDVTAAEAFDAARRAFGGWRAGPDPFATNPVAPPPALDAPQAVLLTGPGPDVSILIKWQGPSVGQTPDLTYAADVFTTIVNDPSSRIQRDLTASGLFQTLSISYLTLRHTGPITLTARTTPDALPRALAALKRELAGFARPDAFDANTLAAARQSRRVGQVLEMEGEAIAAFQYASWWGGAGPDYYRGYADHIKAVTADDVHAFVTTYLRRPYVIGMVGPDAAYSTLALAVGKFAADSTTTEGP
jgi:zinc protease